MPSKSAPFTPSSILFRPRRSPGHPGLWWRRRVPPPGPIGLLRRPFIAIAGLRQPLQYKPQWLTKKEASSTRRPSRDPRLFPVDLLDEFLGEAHAEFLGQFDPRQFHVQFVSRNCSLNRLDGGA